ncbi:PIN domain nuclease [Paraconexibacter algicola]|uniref:Ribonuclease VapC n=1 Tax=Paraconexibacter algicola TaxID=2133960 RepID=A0A2T4UFS1_9ACTN|nr:PIN domain nuclease [Paraconexibacter algicola]PTL56623.1 VapC toxin family PIN domain ribonuclease [Paraconexibacter algicola]
MYLVDTSVLARSNAPAVDERLEPLIKSGLVAVCAVVELEVGVTARSPAMYRENDAVFAAAFARAPIEEPVVRRALQVQAALAERSQHRGVPVNDLVIAACAERGGLTVLHYDADFDTIAQVTGQPMEWIVPRGTVD